MSTENVTINKLELASELAHAKLMGNWNESIKIFDGEEDDAISTYTDEAQDIFNNYYDGFLSIIESCKIN